MRASIKSFYRIVNDLFVNRCHRKESVFRTNHAQWPTDHVDRDASCDCRLYIPSRKSHYKCIFGCKASEGDLVRPSKEGRLSVLVDDRIWVPEGTRSCMKHLTGDGSVTPDARALIPYAKKNGECASQCRGSHGHRGQLTSKSHRAISGGFSDVLL